jgi:hypothetical protein
MHTIQIALAFEQINRLPDRWPAEVILFLKLALRGDWLMLPPGAIFDFLAQDANKLIIFGDYIARINRAIIIVDKMLSGLYQLDYLKYLIESQEPTSILWIIYRIAKLKISSNGSCSRAVKR